MGVFAADAIERRPQRKRPALRGDDAGVEPRNVQKRAEETVEDVDRRLDLVDQRPRRGRHCEPAQSADEETERVNGLAQVMARRGEEFRLGEVGALCDVPLPLKILGEFLGADLQAHRSFERPVRPNAEPADFR